jgi:hypothetical protein
MAFPPETPRSFAVKSRYHPSRILPADFPETKTSVREGSFGTLGRIVEDNGLE